MTPYNPPARWSQEQQRWTRYFHKELERQLINVTVHVNRKREKPGELQVHFPSCLSLLQNTRQYSAFDAAWLDLIAALHPFPQWWGHWEVWLEMLQEAAHKYAANGQQAQQALYLDHAATLLLDLGRLEGALAAAEYALTLAHEVGSLSALLKAGSTAVSAMRSLGKFEQANHLLEALQLQSSSDEEVPGSYLLDLEHMDMLRHQGLLLEAVSVGESMVSRLEKQPGKITDHEWGIILRRRATIYWSACRYEEAVIDLQQSVRLFKEAGDELSAVLSKGNLGLVYYSMASFDRAQSAITEAIKTAEMLNARWWMIRDIGDLTGVYIARGLMDAALVYARRHLDLAQQFNDQAEISRAHSNFGLILVYLDRGEEALVHIEASLEKFQEFARPEGAVASKVDLAVCLRSLGRVDEARDMARQAYEFAKALDFPSLKIITGRCLAAFLPAQEQADLLKQALTLSRHHGRPLDEAGCLVSLAALAESPAEQQDLWQQGAQILQKINASAWLDGRSLQNPPLIALIL